MTNREVVERDLNTAYYGLLTEEVKKLFDMQLDYDFKVFCSQMGDYDHPNERYDAEVELNKKIEDFSVEAELTIEEIRDMLNFISHHKYYTIHYFNDEVE